MDVCLKLFLFSFQLIIEHLHKYIQIFKMGNIICKKEDKISMIGLENSGKTSLLYKLKFNENVTRPPTIGFNVEMVTFQGITFTLWDICGQLQIRYGPSRPGCPMR